MDEWIDTLMFLRGPQCGEKEAHIDSSIKELEKN